MNLKTPIRSRGGRKPCRVIVVGDTVISEQGMAAIVGRDARYQVCGAAHCFAEANKVIRQQRPDLLLIEPFLESHDGIRWINDLATEFPQTRILVVSRQSERTYAERTLRAGASGYWMKNGSAEELIDAIESVLAGETHTSRAIASIAMHKFIGRSVPSGLDVLSDRETAVFSLIAAGHGTGQIAKELGVCRKTIETHCEHIKHKLGYADADALRHGASHWLGTTGRPPAQNP